MKRNIMKDITKNKEMIIMRGCPSAGKSFVANKLAGDTGSVFSADDYHINPENGKYEWEAENAGIAHKWNRDRVEKAMSQDISPVIIDNTHTRIWELKALKSLIQKAKEQGYSVRIEEPNLDWYYWDTAFDIEALYARSKETHNVPLKTIQKMAKNYDKNITIDGILREED